MRAEFQDSLCQLITMGYSLAATPGTADYYISQSKKQQICNGWDLSILSSITVLEKPSDDNSNNGRQNVLEWIKDKRIDLVINIPEGTTRGDEVTSGYLMRRAAVDFGTSLLTNIKY
jgi:hypothetical protein